MDFSTVLLIVLTSRNILSAPTEGCNSLEYLEIGMPGIIHCLFQENVYAVSWSYTNRGEHLLLFRESEKSGIGYTSGEFDILENGSLVIKNVSVDHETIYRVSKFTSLTQEPVQYFITVKAIVKPKVSYPIIDLCAAGQKSCSMTVDVGISINCLVENTRPLINLTWISFEDDGVLPSIYNFVTVDNITFTSRATVKYSLSQLSLLNVFVCQASSTPRNLILDRESSILIDKPFNYTATGYSTVRHIEVQSAMVLPCSKNNSAVFIWKNSVTGRNLWSTIVYKIPSPYPYIESYQTDFEVDNEGSLMVQSVNIKHEGFYVCIHNNDGREEVKLYEVKTYVNPVPAYPVVVGCNNQQYCVLNVTNGDFITCSVLGIRPVVHLEWTTSSRTDDLLFLDQKHLIEENEGVYDVSLTSKIVLSTQRKERATIKCIVVKSNTHIFEMSTTIDLLFEEAVTTATVTPVTLDQGSRVNLILPIIAIVVGLMTVIVIMIAVYAKLKDSRGKTVQQRNKKCQYEEIPMMEVANGINHADNETNKEEIFIAQLKAKYEMLYDSVQPIPYIRDRMYCVDKVFVESGIQYLVQSANPRDTENWKPLGSYYELLGENTLSSDRDILEAEPGYGKSTITLQLAYDWCNAVQHSPLSVIKILIFLRLRQLGGVKSIFEAIRRFILPKDSTLTDTDVKNIIDHSTSVVIVLDGYDEYPDQDDKDTDIYHIISKDIFRKVKVLITTRSSYLPKHRAPQPYRLRIMGFDDSARDKYIYKAVVGEDVIAAKNIKMKLQENPVLEDLCEVPLFFVTFAHITHENKDLQTFKSVTGFFRYMITCFHSHMRNKMEEENEKVLTSLETEHTHLDEIAFKALTGEIQQIVWKREDLRKTLGFSFYDHYVKVGILVEDDTLNIRLQSDVRSPIEVRFYHKLFCEWYAAHYLAMCITKATTDNTSRLLANIDPFDLQYLYRFASGISKDASNEIVKYLRKTKETQKVAILCILEQERETNELLESITELVSNTVTISENDTRLLQRSTLQILNFASEKEIPISDVELRWSFSKVDDGDILLQSGLRLPSLSSLEKISINANRAQLSEDGVIGLLNYGLQSQRFKGIWFYYCELPGSIRCDVIPPSSITRNIKMMRPSHASQFDLRSGKWTTITEIEDIRQLCSDLVVIDNDTSESAQRSVIDVLVKAASHDIPIFRVSLHRSFHSVGVDGIIIILNSGLSLPILSTLERMTIWTEKGREIDEDEANGILNHLPHWERLKRVSFDFCLLPPLLSGSYLPEFKSREVKVFWYPYGVHERSYKLDLEKRHWLLKDKPASLFPTKSTGDVLTNADYNEEVWAFRKQWS